MIKASSDLIKKNLVEYQHELMMGRRKICRNLCLRKKAPKWQFGGRLYLDLVNYFTPI